MPLIDRLTAQVEKQGRAEERQLLSRWRGTLSDFLTPFERDLMRGQHGLELGLEAAPVLKLAIKRGIISPLPGLLRLRDELPSPLAETAGFILEHSANFHVGIRLDAGNAHRELYLTEQGGTVQRFLETLYDLPPMPEGMKPSGWGVDEHQGLSVYFAIYDNLPMTGRRQETVELLEQKLGFPVRTYQKVYGEHYRLHRGAWRGAKHLVELNNFPPAMTTRLVSGLRPSYFGYLAPRRKANSAVLGGTPEGELRGIYFTA